MAGEGMDGRGSVEVLGLGLPTEGASGRSQGPSSDPAAGGAQGPAEQMSPVSRRLPPTAVYSIFKFHLAGVLTLSSPPFSFNSCKKIGACYRTALKAGAVFEWPCLLDLRAGPPTGLSADAPRLRCLGRQAGASASPACSRPGNGNPSALTVTAGGCSEAFPLEVTPEGLL